MASSVWRGSIVVSLISIPVKLYAAARSQRTYLHQIHSVCHTRVRQPLFCPTCNRIVKRDEVVKGYEFDEGQYVLVNDKELKRIAAASSKLLEIIAFAKLKQIDPIFFDASYFCVPDEAGKKAYQVLVKALEDSETVGIGKLTMHQRDYTVFLRVYERGLLLHTMYFQNEIRRLPEYGVLQELSTRPQELKLMEQLILTMTHPFKPIDYHNEFQERLRKLVEAKQEGKTVEIGEEKQPPVIDLMAALKRSLDAGKAAKPTPISRKRLPRKSAKAITRKAS